MDNLLHWWHDPISNIIVVLTLIHTYINVLFLFNLIKDSVVKKLNSLISNNKHYTTDVGWLPGTHFKCYGFQTPTHSLDFHWTACYICPGFYPLISHDIQLNLPVWLPLLTVSSHLYYKVISYELNFSLSQRSWPLNTGLLVVEKLLTVTSIPTIPPPLNNR